MKFTVTMKDPDVLDDAVRRAVNELAKGLDGLDEDEREAVVEARAKKAHDICGKWFEYGEYLRVEIDTDAKTCTVLEVR